MDPSKSTITGSEAQSAEMDFLNYILEHPQVPEEEINEEDEQHEASNDGVPEEEINEEDEQHEASNDGDQPITGWIHYMNLNKAASLGDWKTAESIFVGNPDAMTAPISDYNLTTLHVAVASGRRASFVQKLADLLVQKEKPLGLKDSNDSTALHHAAKVGNTEAARILVERDPTLTQGINKFGIKPLYEAAACGHEEIVRYLLPVTRIHDPGSFAGSVGANLLVLLILDGFYDLAIDVLEDPPSLAAEDGEYKITALWVLAQQPEAFRGASQHTALGHLFKNVLARISSYGSVKAHHAGDLEIQDESNTSSRGATEFGLSKDVHDKMSTHDQVIKLLRSLIQKAISVGSSEAIQILCRSSMTAAEYGIHEFVAEVIKAYPPSLLFRNSEGQTMFDLAIIHRQERVFNLLFQMNLWKHFTKGFDKFGDTMLHRAAKLEPSTRIGRIPGAALQMQRELQWFKAVEEFVQPSYKIEKGKERKTPQMLFTESHRELVKEGERWMKETANSCTIVAALVVTVVFAAAFTVPGGNNGDNGIPIFLQRTSFMVFFISNTLALFSSTTSLLMFLGILTSRYSEEDFLRALPMRLAIGLISLFLAIAAMLAAFSASVYIVLSHRVSWIMAPVALLASVSVALFAFLQFPLLVEVVSSTFGPSIFGKQSEEPLI